MRGLWNELKKRNVFRAALFYIVASWLILQVADLVLDAFDASPAVMRVLIVGFTVGFPVYLLLSWFYEFRGARLVKDQGEDTNVSIRNIRRDANEMLKAFKKDGEISKDDAFKTHDEDQKITDDFIKKIDAIHSDKEKEILEF